MPVVIQRVVGQLDLVEHDRLRGPVRPQGRTVRVQTKPLRTLRLGATRWNPLRAAELESAVADGHHLQQHAVIRVRVQAVHRQSHRGEHSSGRKERKHKIHE